MIKTKTVLVLGAGASAPYEFPIGRTLAAEIQRFAGLSTTTDWCRGLQRLLKNSSEKEIVLGHDLHLKMKQLSEALTTARPPSIDQFLELRSDVADAGRLAIAKSLLQAERKSLDFLWNENTDGHWYNFLKSKLIGPLETLWRNQLRIISFNYDRSFEHYLFDSLWPLYSNSVPEPEYLTVMNQMPLLHIYGSLGSLPWQSPTGTVSYGAGTDEETLIASQGIKILHEGTADEVNARFHEAQEWLKWADRIVFLGFGFHEDNVDRLALKETLRVSHKTQATCKGLDATSIDAVNHCTPWAYKSSAGPAIEFPDPDADCYTLLHKHVVLS